MNHYHFIRNGTVFIRKWFGFILLAMILSFFIYHKAIKYFYGHGNKSSIIAIKLINRLEHPYKAPGIANIDAWINSQPLQLDDLKGKVVLVDFWTGSSINCIRTFSHLKEWYTKYHDQGLEIISIHSPEFEFEHELKNVKNIVSQYNIPYPVALDNHFTTWQNFQNEYWPAHFLINRDGNVVYEHFGEGEYDVTENNIRFLLGLTSPLKNIPANETYSAKQTSEIYLGYDRAQNFSNTETPIKDKIAYYHFPDQIPEHKWALEGKWIIYPEKIVAASKGASIKLHFCAGKVHAVMGLLKTPVPVKFLLNGELITSEQGKDLKHSQLRVAHNQLYSLIKLNKEDEGFLQINALKPGLEIYTFTFGS